MAAKQLVNLSKNLRELRLHLCQKSPSSQGARDFVENHYVSVKSSNPNFPILIRECSQVEPKIYARYGKGVEKSVTVSNKSADEVISIIQQLKSS
uniref:NADH dehydrogenase [ubiquinone] 1 alpha subcomplex subunit 2 n=1 Tax=Ciona savignyi TaxID=51511 RepID=H2YYY3_CIOSA